MISFKEYVKRVDEAQKGNTYNYEKDSGAKGLAHKVGDSVWAKHPTEKHKTLTGKVTKIGRTFTTLQHKDGTEGVYKHADVSSDFEKLNPNPYRKNESEELDESTVDHTLGHKIAKNLGTKLKSFAHGRYKRNNSVIPGNIEYTFHDDKATHKDVHAALVKSGFKAPQHDDIMHDRESMKSWTNSAVSSTHTAHTSQEHGGPLKLHIQARNVSESVELDESGWVSGISKWKEAVNAKHGHALPTFKKVAQPGSPGKSTTYARSSQTGNIIGVYQHHNKSGTVHESVELDEATFVSDSPATYGSRGTKFEVQKNKEKSTGEHANGQPKEHHDVYHEGKHIGHVASYSGYKDKKPAGSRIVTSRKDVRLWQATIHGGEHNRHGSVFNTTPAGSQYTGTGFASKKDALQHLADAHNSNKKR